MNRWTIEFKQSAVKELKKIDKISQKRIIKFLESTVYLESPRLRGKALKGGHKDLWRYRIGNYRVICDLEDEKLVVLVVRVGHRKDVYDS